MAMPPQDDDDLGGPDQLPELERLHRYYEQDTSNNWPALRAIGLIAVAARWQVAQSGGTVSDEQFSGIDPDTCIPVPWWIVEALGIAPCRHNTRHPSADQSLGLAGPTVKEISLAFQVAWHLAKCGGEGIDIAIERVAKHWKVPENKVRESWERHRGTVEADRQTSVQLYRLDALLRFRESLRDARAAFDQDQDSGHTQALFAAHDLLEAIDPYDHDNVRWLFLGLASQRADDRNGSSRLLLEEAAHLARIATDIESLIELDDDSGTKGAGTDRAARDLARCYDKHDAPRIGRERDSTDTWAVLRRRWHDVKNMRCNPDVLHYYRVFRQEAKSAPRRTRQEVLNEHERFLRRRGCRRRKM